MPCFPGLSNARNFIDGRQLEQKSSQPAGAAPTPATDMLTATKLKHVTLGQMTMNEPLSVWVCLTGASEVKFLDKKSTIKTINLSSVKYANSNSLLHNVLDDRRAEVWWPGPNHGSE